MLTMCMFPNQFFFITEKRIKNIHVFINMFIWDHTWMDKYEWIHHVMVLCVEILLAGFK